MPKISEERRTERREQILAGARRCFAEHGYEGATVARLEEAIGALARRDLQLLPLQGRPLPRARVARQRAPHPALARRAAGRQRCASVVEEDPDWLGVYLEMTRQDPHRPGVRDAGTRRERRRSSRPLLVEHVRGEQERGELRDDFPPERVAGFVSLVANGIVLQMGCGERIRDVDALVDFVRAAVGAGRYRPSSLPYALAYTRLTRSTSSHVRQRLGERDALDPSVATRRRFPGLRGTRRARSGRRRRSGRGGSRVATSRSGR